MSLETLHFLSNAAVVCDLLFLGTTLPEVPIYIITLSLKGKPPSYSLLPLPLPHPFRRSLRRLSLQVILAHTDFACIILYSERGKKCFIMTLTTFLITVIKLVLSGEY